MKYILLLLGGIPLMLHAQPAVPNGCGTPSSPLTHLLEEAGLESMANGDSTGTFLVKLYVMSNSLITFYPPQEALMVEAINEANQIFAGSGIQFVRCQEPIFVDSIYFGSGDFFDWEREHLDPRIINILAASIANVCGVAYSIGGGSWSNTGMVCPRGEVLAHEFGHLLGLPHTFNSGAGQTSTEELVDGSNCDTTGDGICDTPADPFPLGGYLDSCAYVGTVTDANGDLYSPHIENPMSYYNFAYYECGPEEFTPGQFTRMRGILNQELFYLLKKPDSMSIPTLTGAPAYICVGDSSYFSLVGSPAGGTFSGDGISGDSLFLGNMPVGDYEITYHLPPAQPVDPYDKIDYVQMAFGYGLEPDTSVWWQSFRAKETAPMTALRLRATAQVNEPFRWALYAGIDTNGTLLYQQTDTFLTSAEMRWRRFELNSSFQQHADSVYTLAFWSDTATSLDVDKGNPFTAPVQLPGSQHGSTGGPLTTDFYPCFATEITSTEPLCYEPIKKRIRIIEARMLEYDIEDNYCVEEGDMPLLDLLPEQAFWTYPEHTFFVNQQEDSLLRPTILGPGSHSLRIINQDINGCKVEKVFPIHIADVPQISVPDTFCQGAAPFALSSLWPAGTYWIDGMPTDSIRPDALTPGSYQLDMELPNVFDTLRVPDQELTWADSGFTSYFLTKDSVFWQSFTPDSSYFFQAAAFRLGVIDTIFGTTELYAGDYQTGSLLLSDSVLIAPHPDISFPEVIRHELLDVPLQADSLYTLVFRPVQYGIHPGVILGGIKDPYPGGEASPIDTLYPEIDWLFKIFQQKERSCGSMQQQNLEILPLPEAPASLLAGPDTVLANQPTAFVWNGTWADSLELSLGGATCLNCPPAGDTLWLQWNTVGPDQFSVLGTNPCGESEVDKSVWVIPQTQTALQPLLDSQLEVYPNPFRDAVTIRLQAPFSGEMKIDFYDLSGRLVDRKALSLKPGSRKEHRVSTKELPPGNYLLQIRVGSSYYRKVLIKEGK